MVGELTYLPFSRRQGEWGVGVAPGQWTFDLPSRIDDRSASHRLSFADIPERSRQLDLRDHCLEDREVYRLRTEDVHGFPSGYHHLGLRDSQSHASSKAPQRWVSARVGEEVPSNLGLSFTFLVLIQSLTFCCNEQYLASLGGQDDRNMMIVWDIVAGKALYGTPNRDPISQIKYFNNSDDKLIAVQTHGVQILTVDKANKKVSVFCRSIPSLAVT